MAVFKIQSLGLIILNAIIVVQSITLMMMILMSISTINMNNLPQEPAITKGGIIAAIVVAFIFFIWLLGVISSNHEPKPVVEEQEPIKIDTPAVKPKPAYSYQTQLLYTNSQTNQPVLLRIAREDIIGGEGQSTELANIHCVFIDPVKKEQIKDVILLKRVMKYAGYSYKFQTFKDGSIYMLYNDSDLYLLNRKADVLDNITNDLIIKHHQLSAGIASLRFNDYAITIITIDGDKVYYIPTWNRMFKNYDQMEKIWYDNDRQPYYEFRTETENDITYLLVKLIPVGLVDQVKYEKVLPDRKFFSPQILYQDKKSLLIATNINYTSSWISIQSLDVTNGKIKWTLPPKPYDAVSATKCQQGYAIIYRLRDNNGIMTVSDDGKMRSDYAIKD